MRIGIDAGTTFTRIAYFDKHVRLHTKSYLTKKTKETIQWLTIVAPNARLMVTGRKAEDVRKLLKHSFSNVPIMQAERTGLSYLLKKETSKKVHHLIFVMIGTETTIHLVKPSTYEQLFSSGIGEGMFIGLGSLLTKEKELESLIRLAEEGERTLDILENVMADNALSVTTAHFGKAHLREHPSPADKMTALTHLVAETIGIFTKEAAEKHDLKHVIFAGGILAMNKRLKESLMNDCKQSGLEAVFLPTGAYVGAIGALLFE